MGMQVLIIPHGRRVVGLKSGWQGVESRIHFGALSSRKNEGWSVNLSMRSFRDCDQHGRSAAGRVP